jgi:hypothetical protein
VPEVTKEAVEKEIGVKITKEEFDFLKQYPDQTAMGKLQELADCRYWLLWKTSRQIEDAFNGLQKIIRNFSL